MEECRACERNGRARRTVTNQTECDCTGLAAERKPLHAARLQENNGHDDRDHDRSDKAETVRKEKEHERSRRETPRAPHWFSGALAQSGHASNAIGRDRSRAAVFAGKRIDITTVEI